MSRTTGPVRWLQAFLDVPSELFAETTAFWAAVTGATPVAPWPEHPQFRALAPPTGTRYLHVQSHDGASRVHLDLTSPDIEGDAGRLIDLGARPIRRDRWWQVLNSPGGLPFCLVAETPGRLRPDPVRWPGGHRSRVAQLTVDVPATGYEAECRFWQSATGWSERVGRRPEYRWLLPPTSSPMQLLLHRLDEATGPTRAHLDIGTDDVPAETRRVRELGATPRPEQPGDDWTVLTDPADLPFCVTPQPP